MERPIQPLSIPTCRSTAPGFGPYLATSPDGLERLSGTVQAFLGGQGHAPQETPGLQQINVFIPSNAPTGAAVRELVVNGTSTQSGVTVAIQAQ